VIILIILIEAGFRRQLRQFVTALSLRHTVLPGLILVCEFRRTVAVLAIGAAGMYVMWQNLAELRN
jgi:hypothetical protein